MVSDNATIFTSAEFAMYCKTCGIFQKFIARGHPATNGQAERFVQTIKHSLKACIQSSTAPLHSLVRNVLLRYRATPLNSGRSPAENYMNCRLQIQLDALRPLHQTRSSDPPAKQNFLVGERVLARMGDKWEPAKIKRRLDHLHYQVTTDRGYSSKKNINQLVRLSIPLPAAQSVPPTSRASSSIPKRVSFDIAPEPHQAEAAPPANIAQPANNVQPADDDLPDNAAPPLGDNVPPPVRVETLFTC